MSPLYVPHLHLQRHRLTVQNPFSFTLSFLFVPPPSLSPGTAIRESVEILNAAGAHLVAVAVSLDRQEKATDTSTESAIQVREHSRSALSQLEAQLVEPHHSLFCSPLLSSTIGADFYSLAMNATAASGEGSADPSAVHCEAKTPRELRERSSTGRRGHRCCQWRALAAVKGGELQGAAWSGILDIQYSHPHSHKHECAHQGIHEVDTMRGGARPLQLDCTPHLLPPSLCCVKAGRSDRIISVLTHSL